ncbi:hypothetical protein WKW80_35365 [Variovorax humicola]|uniref:DyP dimeric alpha+beta barrel domain-containing protein n=1 Tax=Variovorax humicola TaxID=1769758 RepID=A0ABU8WAX5_9BURK
MLPLLLWDIMLAQDKIKRALESLSFVHYARFIPSWDGRALMVTTEFDGPLDPYVLDFVIALGDVFDTLLSYVVKQERPPGPVREHPDEFLAWVQCWNRVPFYLRNESTLFPEDFDYPLYSAYPDKTVTDIAGPRHFVPRPALDHPAAAVDPADVQGNILRGYRARHGRYVFFSVADAAVARRWLAKAFPRDDTPWKGVSSATQWAGVEPEVLTQVAFTHAGLAKLLAPARLDELKHFPVAFKEGAAARADSNFDRGSSAPDSWKFGRADDAVDVVLFLYSLVDPAPDAYLEALAALEGGQAQGLKFLRTLTGKWLEGKEPFGFADGLSDPPISGQCPAAEPTFQPTASPGEFLLHKDYVGIYGGSSLGQMPQGLAGNGTFGVLRLMEQDVDLFVSSTDSEAARLGIVPDQLRAKLVGRWRNGAPLALAPDNDTQANPVNAFDYAPSWEFPNAINDHDGSRCPVGAHVRRANPRSARVAGQPNSRRLLRRGMPASWLEDGKNRVGLMGLFLGASIERQFEFIQRQWLQGDVAASGIRGTTDAISGIRATHTEFPFLVPDPSSAILPPQRVLARIPPLVRTRGCVYLFFPGIAALTNLDASVSPETDTITDEMVDFEFTTALPLGNALLNEPMLRTLADNNWLEIIKDLAERNLDSPWVKRVIESFAPTAIEGKPPSGIEVCDFNLADPCFLAFPHRALQLLRDGGKRIVWVPAQNACWVLDHAGCQELLERDADFVQAPKDTPLRGIATLDPPDHTRVSQAYSAAFGAALAAIETGIESTVAKVIQKIKDQTYLRHFDYMQAFAHPMARSMVWQLIGLKDDPQQRACDKLADTMVLNFGKTSQPHTVESIVFADAGLRLAARLSVPLSKAWVRSYLPGSPYSGTLIGELAARMGPGKPSPAGRPLEFVETLITLVQTVLASQSPHFLLGSAALHLLSPDPRPDRGGVTPWSILAGRATDGGDFDAGLTKALDEARRAEPPLTLVERYADGVQTICDVQVPDGCAVFAMVTSANRDALVFGDLPEQFHFDRAQAVGHLSLGHGIHECAGRVLQKKLLSAALGAMIREMPELRLSNPSATPAWHATIYFRALQALPVTLCSP